MTLGGAISEDTEAFVSETGLVFESLLAGALGVYPDPFVTPP